MQLFSGANNDLTLAHIALSLRVVPSCISPIITAIGLRDPLLPLTPQLTKRKTKHAWDKNAPTFPRLTLPVVLPIFIQKRTPIALSYQDIIPINVSPFTY